MTEPHRHRILISAYACCPPQGTRFSGGEDLLGWQLIQQAARDDEVWVLTHDELRPDLEAAQARGQARTIQFIYLGLPRWLKPLQRVPGGLQLYCYLWQVAALGAARSLHRTVRFDLAHHLTYANDWMASYIGAFLPVPYVRGPGGGAHRVPQGLLGEFSLLGRCGQWCRTVLQHLFRLDPVFRRGQARAHRLLVCNREAFDALPRAWQSKAELWPVNGVGDDELRPPVLNQPGPGRVVVASAGKLVPLKGFRLVIRAFAQGLGQDSDAVLEIVGDGPERPALERLAQRLGCRDRVRFMGWLPRSETLQRLSACDMFVFASLRDGGGAVLVEALAAGRPVICLDLAGPGLHVTPACGVKIPATTSDAVVDGLAAAIRALARDPARRAVMGRAARERAATVYHWDCLGARLRAIYQAACGDVTEPARQGAPVPRDASTRQSASMTIAA